MSTKSKQIEFVESYSRRSTIFDLMSAIALVGFRPFGQACVQFIARMTAGRQPEDMQT